MMDLGELKAVDLKAIWSHGALGFTPWSAENLDRLGRVLGLELELELREAPVGGFSLGPDGLHLRGGRPEPPPSEGAPDLRGRGRVR